MALGREKERLSRLPFFACLDADALHLVAFSAESRKLEPGEVLYRKGDAAEGAVLVVSGTLSLGTGDGGAAGVRIAGPGTLLGESALLAPGERPSEATARDRATVIAIQRSLMLRVLQAYPSNAEALRRYWAERLGRRIAEVRTAVQP